MKKIILMSIIILQTCFGFSQEKSKQEISEISLFALNTAIRARFRQTVLKQDMQLQAGIREGEVFEIFLGRVFPLTEGTFAVASVGIRNSLENRSIINELIRVEFRSRRSWGMIRVNYGLTNFTENGVSSNIVLNFYGRFLRAGLASNNEHFGPRVEVMLPLGDKVLQRSIRFQFTLLSNGSVAAGFRLRFGGRYKL